MRGRLTTSRVSRWAPPSPSVVPASVATPIARAAGRAAAPHAGRPAPHGRPPPAAGAGRPTGARSTASSIPTAATGSRCSGSRPRYAPGPIAVALHDRGLRAHRGGARAGQRRDPRAAASRRMGVGGRVDGAAAATTCWRWSSGSSRPSCSTWFAEQRAAIGIEVVPLGPDVVAYGARARCATTASCACCRDRDIAGDGVEVEFFGERTTLPGGPATLALRTGRDAAPGRGLLSRRAAITSGWCGRRSRSQRLGRLREDIARITQALARRARDR